MKGWEDDSDNEEHQEQQVQLIFGNTGPQLRGQNQYDDNGTVLTMDSDLSGWSSASNYDATVDKVAKRMKKLLSINITEE